MKSLSRQDVKNIACLKQKKYRIEEGKLLVEGARFVIEALHSDWYVDRIIQTHSFREHLLAHEIDQLARKRGTSCHAISAVEFKKIADTVSSQGIVAVIRKQNPGAKFLENLLEQRSFFMLAVEALTDPGNLGTLIRTAAWFGVEAIVTGPHSVSWHNPKALRASMGAIFHVPVIEASDLVEFLEKAKKRQTQICCADQKGDQPYGAIAPQPRRILLIGNETAGVSETIRALADQTVMVPRKGTGESLNAAIAAAIIIAEFSKGAQESSSA